MVNNQLESPLQWTSVEISSLGFVQSNRQNFNYIWKDSEYYDINYGIHTLLDKIQAEEYLKILIRDNPVWVYILLKAKGYKEDFIGAGQTELAHTIENSTYRNLYVAKSAVFDRIQLDTEELIKQGIKI